MRIHRLEIEAFGPFAGAQEIDFDGLASQGLFLLNGATGAGKTSVLDAVCFALYGSVPGARQDGKRLRSDHAAPDAEPRVVCEFSARGRHFEVTRFPAWDRPSARGKSGFTQQKAKTLLRERVGGSWEEKTSRNDEAGAEISAILGMDREQFTRVVMLPQGDFAAFLRSKASDRMELLQKLFGTQRFEAIEQELSRLAQEARAEVSGNDHAMRVLRDRAEAEAGELGLAGREDPDTAAAEAASAGPESRLQQLEALAEAEEARRRAEARGAEVARDQLRDRLQAALERASRHERLEAAVTRRDVLEARRGGVQAVRDRLGRHRRASVLGGQLDAVDASRQALVRARDEASRCTARLTSAGLATEAPDEALASTQEVITVLEARLSDEQKLDDITRRLAAIDADARRYEATRRAAVEGLARLRAEAADKQAELAPLEAAAGQLAALEEAAKAASAAEATVARYAAAIMALAAAEGRHRQSVDRAQELRQAWLDFREARLANAAAELSSRLADDEPCPVCGSCEHPSPAVAGRSVLALAEEEESARIRFEDSERHLAAAAAALAAAEQQAAVLAGQGGDADPGEAKEAAAAAGAAVDAAEAAEAALVRARHDVGQLEDQIARLELERLEAGSAAVQAGASAEMLREQQHSLDELLTGLRAGYATLRSRLDALLEQRGLLADAAAVASRLERALDSAGAAAQALAKALPGAGFDSADQATAELLDAGQAANAEATITRFDAEAARLEELFGSEDLVLAAKERDSGELALARAELALLEAEAAEANASVRSLELAAGLAAKARAGLAAIREEFLRLADAGRDPRERAMLLTELADTAKGSGDNNYRMSLNSYVLAARLEQVAEAASERLTAMSDGRYTLRHSDAKAARGAKSGLGLEVVDQWTGHHRDTSTLSGGESFMASLSLALGLADVVQQEAGGVDIETLFVDEGFGSLDELALEQVMDALEGLRDGGRVVGLVSHVAEMKLRISSQLQVIKGRNGSTIRILEAAV